MDDRKFREIMEDYARSTAKGKETDFAKANAETTAPRKKINLRLVTAVCSVVIIVAVSLAVALPLTLGGDIPSSGGNDGQGVGNDDRYYCKEENTLSISVDILSDLLEEYSIDIMLPEIGAMASSIYATYSEEYNVTIGARVDLNVFDEYFDIVSIRTVKFQYILEGLTRFDDCTERAVWNGNNILYFIEEPNAAGCRKYYITFTAEGYNYFIELDCYGELDVATVLDMIYG